MAAIDRSPAEPNVLRLRGDADLADRDAVAQAGHDVLSQHHGDAIVIDMAELTFLDSTIIGVLLELRKAATQSGTEFALRAAPTGVRRLLAVTGLDGILPIIP